MIYNRPGIRIVVRILLLVIEIFTASYLLISGLYLLSVIALAITCYQSYDLFLYMKKAESELKQFVESVHYRDFSRHFDVRHAPSELQPLRQGFNEINSAFKV